MAPAILQLLLLLIAGAVLFLLWRRYVAPARFGSIVTAGFLLRTFAGQVLFWISWLELPFLRHLQEGKGLWFFALDAHLYVPVAFEAADHGLLGIILHTRTVASVTFVQVLAFFAWCFGPVVSVALLVNLFAFLGLCIIIIRWSAAAEVPGNRAMLVARIIALAALSLSPSAILWSLQPLKDILFQFLVVAFLGAAVAWQQAWRTKPGLAAWGAAAVMFAAIFGIGGVRWYFAFILLVTSFLFVMIVSITAGTRRVTAAIAALLLFAALSQALRFGAGPYLPERILRFLAPSTFASEVALVPRTITSYIEEARGGFERGGGATTIRVSRKTPPPPVQVARQEPAALTAVTPTTTGTTTATSTATSSAPPPSPQQQQPKLQPKPKVRTTPASDQPAEPVRTAAVEPVTETVSAEPRPEPKPAPTAVAAKPAPTPAPTQPNVTHPAPAQTAPAPAVAHAQAPAPTPAAPAPVTTTTATPTTTTSAPAAVAAAPPAQTPTPAPVETRPAESPAPQPAAKVAENKPPEPQPAAVTAKPKPRPRRQQPATQRAAAPASQQPAASSSVQPPPAAVTPAPVPAPVVAAAPAAPLAEGATKEQDYVLPTSKGARVAAGAAAMLVPQTVSKRLGLIEVGGGRGLMWFTDLDTLVFDALLLASMIIVVRRLRRSALSNGAFWMLAIATMMVGLALIYTVTNFGTLFRLRAMVYTGLALIPLTLLATRVRSELIVQGESGGGPQTDALS